MVFIVSETGSGTFGIRAFVSVVKSVVPTYWHSSQFRYFFHVLNLDGTYYTHCFNSQCLKVLYRKLKYLPFLIEQPEQPKQIYFCNCQSSNSKTSDRYAKLKAARI